MSTNGGRRLVVVGLSHKSAPLEVRERAAFADARPALAAALNSDGVGEALLLSTCNRVELYAGVDGQDGLDLARRFFLEFAENGRRPGELAAHLYLHEGDGAARHLFRVAASLDSMVVGESQILGQVKEAWRLAQEAGALGPLLQRTLPRAFASAKRVRSETRVAESAASVASVAVELAGRIFGSLAGREVLVVGAGKMGELAARHLKESGARELVVVNRTAARATELAARLGARVVAWEELDRALERADVVVSSTGAAQPVITRERVARVMKARKGRWLFFVDIAVPRDIEPSVAGLENVYLYDIDGLQAMVAQNLAARGQEAESAAAIVEEELTRHFAAEQALGVVPTLKRLREHFLSVARAEVRRTLPKLSGASEREQQLVEHMAEAIAQKLLHAPLTALKREASGEQSELLTGAVRTLFGLDDSDADEASAPKEQAE